MSDLAYSRKTRTPIRFQPMDDQEGEFRTPAPLTFLQALPLAIQHPSLIPSLLSDVASKGLMTVDPDQPNVGSTVKHESVHAIQETSPVVDKIAQLAFNTPGFGILSTALKGRSGNMENEVPAYAAEKYPSLPANIRDSFIGNYVQKLMQLDPNTAKMYQELSK